MTYQSKKTSSRGKAPEAASSSRGASPVAPGVPRFLTARGKVSVRPARDQQSELDAERAGARMREGG
ncbi:MAG TPA: hypothetical protein PLC86_18985, partial [Candidatus Accumulibacter phosphatis]|nr:hypothetical protein [Candidatus Accumulibacter phosphatis]